MEGISSNSSRAEVKNSKYSNRLRDFCENTTLHGARYLTDKTICRRVTWVFLVCGAFAFCGFQIHNCLSAYYQRPISTFILTNRVEMLDFPAVTVCNLNAISRASYVTAVRKRNMHITKEQAAREVETLMFLMSAPLPTTERSKRLNHFFNNDSLYYERGDELRKTLQEFSHSLEGMLSIKWLKPCEWKNEKCGVQNLSTFLHVRRGKCFTFNSGKPGHPKLRTNIAGASKGLRLRLNVEEKHHIGNFYSLMAGFKVFVHDQRDAPAIDDSGFGLKPGTHTYCALKLVKHLNLQAPYETNCMSNYTDINKCFDVDYSINSCRIQCLHNQNIKECGCQSIYNITAGVPLCSLKDTFECTFPIVYGQIGDEVADCVRRYCPRACKSITYETKLSYTSAISNSFARYMPVDIVGGNFEELFESFNKNTSEEKKKDFFRENVATLDVYFEDMTEDIIKQMPTFDDWALIGAIGGYIGLFLGASVLTVMELIDLIVTKMFSAFRRSRGNVTRIEVR